MHPYPVHFDVAVRPAHYDRWQIALRLLVLLVLGVVGAPVGMVIGFLYLALPIFAAIVIADRGPVDYLAQLGPRLERWIGWLIAVYAYVALLTDRFPTHLEPPEILFSVDRGGTPTVRSSLVRLVKAIPSALMVLVLGLIGGLLWIVAAIFVLAKRGYPDWIFEYQRGLVRLVARLFGYQASLVDAPAPLTFDTTPESVEPVTP
jgi:hypothetical protein